MGNTKQLKAILMKCIECQEELKIHLMNLDKEISIIELKETTIDNLSTVEKEIIK